MSDLAKTQAAWNHFNEEEFALFLSTLRILRETRDTVQYERTQVAVLDSRGYIASLTLAGIDYGVNTTADGLLYVRLTANGGNWDVHIYKATGAGGGDEVASVTNIAADGTAALVAANSSGISGSITLGSSIAAVAADTLVLWVKQDLRKRARVKLDGTGSKDSNTLGLVVSMCDDLLDKLNEGISTVVATVTRWATEKGQSGQAFMGRSFSSLISDTEDGDTSGSVTRVRTGFLPEFSEAMADDTTAGEQDVVKRVVAASSGSFDGANTGLGAVSSHTPLQHCPVGVWRFSCVDGADTDAMGSERFDGTFKDATTDEEFTFSGLVVGQQWTGPKGFGPITLTRTKSKTNDGSNLYFAAASGAVVSGENGQNTDSGALYITIEANGSNWDISFYSDSYRTSLVAKATNVATSAAFTATEKNGSGLTVAWTMGGTPGAIATIALNLNPFVTQNSDGFPDNFSITTSVTGTPGLIQETVGEELGFSLNSDDAGSETFEDEHMKAGTFVPFLVQDN